MKYELNKELSSLSLSIKPVEGRNLVFDRLEFPVPPREPLRLELQKGLKEVAQQAAVITSDCLLKYNSLEKYEAQFYLVRQNNPKIGLEPFQIVNIEQSCQALFQIIEVIKLNHQQGKVLGGLSLGQLKQDHSGKFYLQDPLIINFLSKSLTDEYKVDAPPEVIHGNSWDPKSDIFSWGVLAYRLLTAQDPFTAMTPEERMAKILKLGVVSPKDIKPELSNELSQLVIDCLSIDPRKRPDLDTLILKLTQLLESGALTVDEVEVRDYQEKALANRRRYQTKERFWFWFRKYGIATLISFAAIAFFVLTWVGSQSKPVITEKNTPGEVIAYYFKGVQMLDVTLVAQTLHQTKNSFSDMVTNLYVINKTQQGMTYSLKDNIKLDFLNLNIKPLVNSTTQAKYKTSYTLKVSLSKEIQYIERVDRVTLQPVWKVWRITKIDVLHEKRWGEKLADQSSHGPAESVKLPSTLESSNIKR